MKQQKNRKPKKASLAVRILSDLAEGALDVLESYPEAANQFWNHMWRLHYKGFSYKYFLETANRVEKKGWVKTGNKGPAIQVLVTKKGFKHLRKKKFHALCLKKPKVWDGLWRAVSFDIPEEYRRLRSALRLKLRDLGFVQVQKSLWVCPYECREELVLVCEYYKIQKYVALFEGKYIGDDSELKKPFNLR